MFGDAEELSAEERRIAELKETLYKLATKFRQKQETEKLYHFPDQEEEGADMSQSRQQRLFNKLNAKYHEERPRGGPPELTEEERF